MLHTILMRFLLLAVCLSVAVALDVLPPRARGGVAHKRETLRFPKPASSAFKTLPQLVNHFDGSTTTWTQRYAEVTTYWSSPNGPVLLYISGEGPMSGAPSGYILDVAKNISALVVGVEHRFYGESQPTGGNLTVSDLQLLSVEEELADLAYFIDWYTANTLKPQGGGDNKWISVGGSYAGALSAFFRTAYPDKVVGAWSSSGVVNALLQFWEFDEQVRMAAGEACGQVLQKTNEALEAALAAEPAKTRALFGAENLSDTDFFYMTADSAAMAVQYGSKQEVCDWMTQAVEAGADLPAAFANFTAQHFGPDFGGSCFYDSTCLVKMSKAETGMARTWRWQKCSELAYLQVAPWTGSLRSQALTLNVLLQQCEQVFADGVFPNVVKINQVFRADRPKGTNIVFINSSDDPWLRAGVDRPWNPLQEAIFIKCHGCGHCRDLHAPSPDDPPEVPAGRALILKAVRGFLNM